MALIALSMLADGWVAEHVRYGRVYETDWGRMLRDFGYLPFWLLAAIALALHDRQGRGEPRSVIDSKQRRRLGANRPSCLGHAKRRRRGQKGASRMESIWKKANMISP
mgnify:CR=1 FL=1